MLNYVRQPSRSVTSGYCHKRVSRSNTRIQHKITVSYTITVKLFAFHYIFKVKRIYIEILDFFRYYEQSMCPKIIYTEHFCSTYNWYAVDWL